VKFVVDTVVPHWGKVSLNISVPLPILIPTNCSTLNIIIIIIIIYNPGLVQ
jgi:hypothetical protein